MEREEALAHADPEEHARAERERPALQPCAEILAAEVLQHQVQVAAWRAAPGKGDDKVGVA